MFSLVAGAHVLCEKPLVARPGLATPAQLYLAEKLVEAARELGLILAVNTQYAAAADPLRAICEAAGVSSSPVTDFFMQMESRGGGGARESEAIWHDLAAHPLSVLLALVPDGRPEWSSAQCVIEPQRNDCTFDFVSPGGGVCRTRILLRNVPEGPMERQFALNGVNVKYEGRNDEDGTYCAYLTQGGREVKVQDFMEASITRFADAARGTGSVLATGEEGLRNLEMQLRLLETA
jgi:predicted dehydrogenase